MELELISWGGVVQVVIGLALQIALLAVALTAVRPRRPDAAGLLVIAACIGLVTTCLTPVAFAGINFLDVEIERFATVSTLMSLVAAVLHAVAFGFVIAGIARLARPRDATDRG